MSSIMSLKQLKDEAAHLPPTEQRELIAFLVSMQTEGNIQFKDRLATKIDDTNSGNWVELDDLKKHFQD